MSKREAVWMPMRRLHLRSVPGNVEAWLSDPDSLTQRLTDYCSGRFHVRLLNQEWTRPLESERQVLMMAMGERGLVREVELWCDSTPLVFARTVIPVSSMKGRVRGLTVLGNRPLGAVLFNDRSTQRELFEVAELRNNNRLFRRANQALAEPVDILWGRRTRFRYAGQPLLVHEIFLPTIVSEKA
ncbi:chorismate--pyruvate lyase family protein [Solemya velum gill symbiont]|uniref:chorismate--pyruvate lyase family protein n=1 Tax=Solemya velum gill symbiont TaxID=2340 RepID=UPI000998D342|nr:chorismate lyase [Solemya velum gill symbiont]